MATITAGKQKNMAMFYKASKKYNEPEAHAPSAQVKSPGVRDAVQRHKKKNSPRTLRSLRWIFLLLFFASFAVEALQAQTAPSGYTSNFRFRMWNQGANPSADSLNANWKDIDHQIYKRGWMLGSSKVYPTVAGWKAHFRNISGDTTGSALVNIYGNTDIGSSSVNAIVTQSYNAIVAPDPGVAANIIAGIKAVNNTAATSLAHNNSPALQLKQFSWNPTAGASQENSWYAHNWGFATSGTAGGVFTVTNKRPSDPNTYSSFAIDEIGRTVIGYTKSHGSNYYGFWGEDFGQWGVILAHTSPVVIGWPENSVTTDFYVTGNTKLTGNLGVGTTASAKTHILSTTEQLRLGYDASNYFKVTVGSNGLATLAGAGSGAAIATALNINSTGTISSSTITTSTSLVVNPSADHATVDVRAANTGYNVGLGTFYGGVAQWLIGNHTSANFSLYSYGTGTDVFTVNRATGVVTTTADVNIKSVAYTWPSANASGVLTNNGSGTLTWAVATVPSGVIVMWSGSIASIPSGWALCDGTSGTPDLRDRFIVGAGSTYAVAATGGAATVILSTSEIPSHTHTFTGTAHNHGVTDPGHTHTYNATPNASGFTQLATGTGTYHASQTSGSNTTGVTVDSATAAGTNSNTGSGNAHENRPPYYALAYIMKL